MDTTLDWKLIAELGASLGVKPKALEKWRERGSVPHRWRPKIIRASEGALSWEVFENESVRA